MLAFALILFGILSRFVVHAPNFTPVIAIALFSGVYLRKSYSFTIPLLMMILSDIIIGFHDTLLFTWGSVLLISWIGVWLRGKFNIKNTFMVCLTSSVLFFVITNFGAWLSPLYPHTLGGLQTCFIAAIPFFRNTLVSSLFFSVLMFGSYQFLAVYFKNTRLAKVVLLS